MVLLTSSSALAQPGDGIKVGNARLHPFAETELHHVHNPNFSPPGGDVPGTSAPTPARDMVLIGRGGFELEQTNAKLDLTLRGALEWDEYLGVYDDYDEVTNRFSDWGGELGLDATYNKDAPLSFRLTQSLNRSARASASAEYITLRQVTSLSNLGVNVRPGGGALTVTSELGFFYQSFPEPNANANPGANNNFRVLPALRATWKFLPKTALVLESKGTFVRYPNDQTYVGTTARNQATSKAETYLGLIGDVTQRVSLLLKAGYTGTFVSSAGSLHRPSAQGELTYTASPTQKAKVGVLRMYEPSTFYPYYELTRGYLHYEHLLFGTTHVRLEGNYSYLGFAPSVVNGTTRADGIVTGSFTLEHKFTAALSAALVERVEWRESSYEGVEGAAYLHNDVWLGVKFRY